MIGLVRVESDPNVTSCSFAARFRALFSLAIGYEYGNGMVSYAWTKEPAAVRV